MTADVGALRRDDRGLIGTIVLLVLALVVVVAIAVVDAGSIVLSHVRVADLAQDAAFAGGERYAQTQSRRQTVRAALATVAEGDEDARMRALRISAGGAVTVVVEDRAGTLLAGRLGFLDEITSVSSSQTHDPADG